MPRLASKITPAFPLADALEAGNRVKSTLGFFDRNNKNRAAICSRSMVVPTSRPSAKREAPAISQGSSRASVARDADAVDGRATMTVFVQSSEQLLTFGFGATPAASLRTTPVSACRHASRARRFRAYRGHCVDDAATTKARSPTSVSWSGDDAVAVIDSGGSVREGAPAACRDPAANQQADPLRDQHARPSRPHFRQRGIRGRADHLSATRICRARSPRGVSSISNVPPDAWATNS